MNAENFKGKSLTSWREWSPEDIRALLALSAAVKRQSRTGEVFQRFTGKTVALIFEKRSTRTRCAFETAFGEEGGHPVFLSSQDIQLGAKESVEDTARVLGRMFSAIQFRGFSQQTVETLAQYAGVPVYNGLTDSFHPTQALADILTVQENFGSIEKRRLVFAGDGRNNVARSLMVICSKLGIDFSVISPKQLFPGTEIRQLCAPWAEQSGAKITVSDDISLVKGADVLYTDVWVSMGEEKLREEKNALLLPYQVNDSLMEKTENPFCIFMHCLPAVKGEEVTVSVIEGRSSRVWDQAENRKHTIKAIMLATIPGVECRMEE